MNALMRRRLNFMGGILVAVAILVLGRLIDVQIVRGAALRWEAEQARRHQLVVPEPPRGMIYDRNGLLLTTNELRYAVEAHPILLEDNEQTRRYVAERLAPILHVPSTVLMDMLSGDEGVSLEPSATVQEGEAIREMGLMAIEVRRRWRRRYPHGETAAYLLGFVNWNGEGFYGVEGRYDRVLQPQVPQWEGEAGPTGERPLPQEEGTVTPPLRGADLVLTVDLAVQAVVEEELAGALQEFGASSGTVIVMDPRSGAILALASLPSFDPNQYDVYLYRGQDLKSPAYGTQYEPGSVFKIITVAAALDGGTIVPSTTYVDTGRIEWGGQVFTNWDQGAYGEQGLVGLLGHSLNVGAVWLATQMGPDEFYRYVRAFGFGELTGVDLQGEASGSLRVPGDLDWHDSDLGTNSFGQGLAVTPLQMISAAAAVANGGRLMRPYVVARQIFPDGTVVEAQPIVRGQPISAETARVLSEILAQAVEQHVPQAQVEGYRIAGKTGTSQIPIAGGYDPRWTIGSFVGFGPLPDPQVVILVRLDRPQTSQWGSQTAALLFQRLATRLFPMLGIAPQ